MKIVIISSQTADTLGHILIRADNKSDLGQRPVRVTRTATLDGGAHITNLGMVDGDRTIVVEAWLSETDIERLNYIIGLHPKLYLSCEEGLFLGAISYYKKLNSYVTLTFLPESREDAE